MLLNKVLNVEVSDTTGDEASVAAGIKFMLLISTLQLFNNIPVIPSNRNGYAIKLNHFGGV
jgi:hypothetical protein